MMKRLATLLLCLGVSACQSPNPYVASSNPLPPAPPQAQKPVDMSAYPAQTLDYGHYRNWTWVNNQLPPGSPWASPEQLAEAVSNGLDQRGLRPVMPTQAADLGVTANLHMETRLRQVQEDVYAGGGYYGGYHRYGYGGYSTVPVVRTYQVQVLVFTISLFDNHSGQPVWHSSAETAAGGDQSGQAQALRQAIAHALATYPPA
ncbi:MAG: DUF4136 domain-containing protein [Pseudomonas sp.]